MKPNATSPYAFIGGPCIAYTGFPLRSIAGMTALKSELNRQARHPRIFLSGIHFFLEFHSHSEASWEYDIEQKSYACARFLSASNDSRTLANSAMTAPMPKAAAGPAFSQTSPNRSEAGKAPRPTTRW